MDAILLDKNTIEYYYELYQPNNIPQSTREPNIVDWRWDEGWKMMEWKFNEDWWNPSKKRTPTDIILNPAKANHNAPQLTITFNKNLQSSWHPNAQNKSSNLKNGMIHLKLDDKALPLLQLLQVINLELTFKIESKWRNLTLSTWCLPISLNHCRKTKHVDISWIKG
jgi:hypothetical protein